MWRKYKQWEQQVEGDTLLVLDNPDMLSRIPDGCRRRSATHLASMSPLERMALRNFIVKYRGAQCYPAIAKMLFLFSIAGVLLHLSLPETMGWTSALLISNLLGFSLAMGLIGVWFSYRRLVAGKGVKILLRVAAAALVGLLFGLLTSALFSDKPYVFSLEKMARTVGIGLLVVGLLYIIPLGIVAIWRNRQHDAASLRLQQEAERERMARELSESQLRLLRAQIEPHFLFNTLGAVQQLAEQGAPKAAELTANLIAFLRASLAEMRTEHVALQSEFDMVEAYLRVMQVRMGARLRFRLDLPPGLAHVTLPSMIVLTLVENAIKHGIEPALRGGDIHIAAELVGGMLRLRVQDTGVGLPEHAASPAPGSGLGLENVRSRLRLASAAATLDVRNADDGGAIADIFFPHPVETTPERAA